MSYVLWCCQLSGVHCGSVTCAVEINKLAVTLVKAAAALFHNQTVCKPPWRATTAFSCGGDAAGGGWHGRAPVFLCVCSLPETRRKWTQLSPKAATPCRSHSLFPLHNVLWTEVESEAFLQPLFHLSLQSGFGGSDSTDFMRLCHRMSTLGPGHDCYTSPVGVLMSVEPEYFHIWF